MEAFKSRSRTKPHSGQDHSRSFSCSSLLMYPHSEHVFELGSNLPILRMFTPFHLALYSSMVMNIPHETSEIEPAKQWFFSIPEIFRSSKAIDWFSLINSVLTLCKKSFLWLATFSCKTAKRCLRLFDLCFENCRCWYFKRLIDLRKHFGLSYSLPFDATRNDLIPKSKPTVVSSFIGLGCFSISPVSQRIDTKYLSVGVLLIVACLISPFIGLCRTISTPFLNLGIINLSLLILILCGMLKDCLPLPFFLNLGKSARPLKKFSKAVFILTIDCCNDWLLTSFNHSFSFFKSGNLFTRLYQEWFVLSLAYSDCLKARASLYTKRAQPICLLINSACVAVGFKRYLNAFNILQIYKIYFNYYLCIRIFITFVENVSVKGVAYIPPSLRHQWVLRSIYKDKKFPKKETIIKIKPAKKNDKCSVIINTYKDNLENLRWAIESYLTQKNIDVQLILSTVKGDDSIQLAKKYKEIDLCISEQPGIYPQLNKALTYIKHEWFAYASGNDEAYQTKLYDEISLCKKHKKLVCYSAFDITFDGIVRTRYFHNYSHKKHLGGNFISDCALIHKDLIKKYGPFKLEWGNYAFYDFWLRIYEGEGNVFVYNPEPTWNYIVSNNSLHIKRKKNPELTKKYESLKQKMIESHVGIRQ